MPDFSSYFSSLCLNLLEEIIAHMMDDPYAGCLEAGYEDYQQIREDPDLEAVRGDSRFQQLISKYAKSNGNGFFGNMLKGFKM